MFEPKLRSDTQGNPTQTQAGKLAAWAYKSRALALNTQGMETLTEA